MSFTERLVNGTLPVNDIADHFLDEAKRVLGVATDYQLAKKLEVSTSRISNYRRGRKKPDADMCIRLEKVLADEYPAGHILMSMEASRATDPNVRMLWAEIVGERMEHWRTFGKVAAAVLLALIGWTICPDQDGGTWLIAWSFAGVPMQTGVCIIGTTA